MPMEAPIADVIYPYTKNMTGIRRYSEKLIQGFRLIGAPVRVHRIRKIEYSFRGKPAGGVLSQRFQSLFVMVRAPVVHTLAPDLATKRTNLVTVHDTIPFKLRDVFVRNARERLGYRIMFSRLWDVDIIVQTEYTKRELITLGVKEDRIHVCGVSVDSIFRPSDSPSPYPENGLRHIVTVGDFNPRKRFDLIYRAVAGMKGVEIYHAGAANRWLQRKEELEVIAKRAGNIHMLGDVPDSELVRYLQHADLLVFISEDEGVGYPVAEAMSCGTPVLVNELEVFRELYGSTAHYCGMGVDEIRSGIEETLSAGKNAQMLVSFAARFSPEQEARRVLSVYENIAGIRH